MSKLDKKVGVLTHYHNSINYGGVLQAYALINFLTAHGVNAQQISFNLSTLKAFPQSTSEKHQKVRANVIFRIITYIRSTLTYKIFSKYKNFKFVKRNENFKVFRDCIAHTSKEYNSKNAYELNKEYDTFVTGSDQVWNFDWFSSSFFLDFVDSDKKKVAYAVSTGKTTFTNKEKEFLKKYISTFDGLSVRERDLTESLNELGVETQWVVDPTLLLTAEDWDKIAVDRLVDVPYLFCYFLGNDERIRRIAKKYAKKHNLVLVTIPFANQSYNKSDFTFGDIKIFDAGPKEFISLIKNAEYVFTDSFHASVFSLLYKRQFFAFARKNGKKMGSRLVSLTALFECSNRFCEGEDRFCLDYLEKTEQIDYNKNFQKFNELKQSSIDFLLSNLRR